MGRPVAAARLNTWPVVNTTRETFGNQSDWSRNVRAAGGCSIRLNGVEYQVNRPELADWAQAGPSVRAAYSPAMRAMFRLLGIR